MLEEWQARSRTRSVSHVTRFIDEKQRPQKLKEGKESKKREGGNKEREGKGEEAVVACPSPPKFRFRIEEFPEVTNPFSFALADRGLGCS